jgi:ATP-binding cassette subfamily B protein
MENTSRFPKNIAFGLPWHAIDLARDRSGTGEAGRRAGSDCWLHREQPHGYDYFVGERCILLSGGQLQRIGIALALYKQASLIVLDEATRALDTSTE